MLMMDVYQAMYGPETNIKKVNLIELAAILSEIVNREKPWTFRNLHGILKGYKGFTITPEMARALSTLANRLDGQSPLQSRVIGEITVLNINGVEPGSIVLGHTERCAFCLVKFVPRSCTNPDHNRYCCSEHRQQYYKEKRKGRRVKHG